jgi:hypothetical protein
MTNKKVMLISAALLLVVALSAFAFQGGNWYGYANGTSPQDREQELRNHWGPFTRVTVPFNNGSIYPVTLGDLCRRMGKTCLKVGDWEGHEKGCDEFSQGAGGWPIRDGSRIVLCSAQ